MSTNRKMETSHFFAANSVFSLAEATAALGAPRGTSGTVERLKHHLDTGRLKLVERGLYAVVPPNSRAEMFQPDPFLVARAARPDAVFCYHSALELLGVAHSAWKKCIVFTESRRPPLKLKRAQVLFLDHPAAARKPGDVELGTRKVERLGFLLRVTGPERTLVEGLRRPDLVGGLPELTTSASGFATLDLALLERVLKRYNERKVWAAAGWFLEQHQKSFHVPDEYLQQLEQHRPRSPLYVPRRQRGGMLNPRWNVILPAELMQSEPMSVSLQYLERCAGETGYQVATLEKVTRLGEIAAEIAKHPLLGTALALKGGTALNLCMDEGPTRMSVDLDYNYIARVDREQMLADRAKV